MGFYNQGFFRSFNNGIDWVELNTGLKNKSILSITRDNDFIFAATYDGLYRFEKANYTWTKKSDGINNIWVSKLAEVNNKLIIGTYGSGLYIKDSDGLRNINLGPDFMFILDVLAADGAIYVTANNSYPDDTYAKLFFYSDYGNWWSQIYTGRDLIGLKYIAKNDKYLYLGGSFGLYRKPIIGDSWDKLTNFISVVTNIATFDSIIIVTNGTSEIFRSTDYGDSWQSIHVNNLYSGNKIVSTLNGDFYLATGQITFLFKSTDQGLTWQKLNNPVSVGEVQSIYTKDENIFVGLSQNGILVSENGGVSWDSRNTGLYSKNITSFVSVENNIYAGSYLNGIYKRVNAEYVPIADTTLNLIIPLSDSIYFYNKQLKFYWISSRKFNRYRFQLSEDTLFEKIIIDDKNINDTSFFVEALDYNKYYYWRVSGVTMVWDNHFSKVQKIRIEKVNNFQLYNNYPNPFNSLTNIIYNVAEYSEVTITIYDILGNKVETVVNDKKLPGRYYVNWNASKYASGVYIYKMKAGEYVETKKMIFLK